ncbi:MAG: UbiA family prenyltransferase [bacterium]
MVKEFIQKLENKNYNFASWLALIASVIIVRVILESVSSNGYNPYNLVNILHLTIFFLTLLLSLILVAAFFTKERIEQISKFFAFGFFLLWSAPIVDLLLSWGKGYQMAYMFVGINDLISNLFSFFGPILSPGITFGMRVQILLAMLALTWYVWHKTRSLWKAVSTFIVSYLVAFFYGALPSLFVYVAHPAHLDSGREEIIDTLFTPKSIFAIEFFDTEKLFDVHMALVLLPILIIQLLIWYGLISKEKLWAFLKNLRLLRLLFQIVALGSGIYLGSIVLNQPLDLSAAGILMVLALALAVISAWSFSVIVNDYYDTAIDAVTNKNRPLIKKTISQEEFIYLGVVSFIISVLAAGIVGYVFFLLIMGINALSYVYSALPLRLRRFPFLTSFVIALATLFIAMSGFALFTGDNNLSSFPKSIIGLILIIFTLVLNAKDIKDREGDKANNVITIPTLLGERAGKLVIGTLIFASFTLFAIILQNFMLFVGSLGFGIVGFFLVYDKRAKEKYVFILYALYMILVLLTTF